MEFRVCLFQIRDGQAQVGQEQCERLRSLAVTALRRQCTRFVLDNAVGIGERSSKGYVLEEMLDAFRRYVPRSEIDDLRGQTRPVAEEEKEEEESAAG